MKKSTDLIFSGVVTDIASVPKEDQNLEEALFNDKTVKDTIDQFEKMMGINRTNNVKVASRSVKNIVLEPEKRRDKQLLNDLMNDKSKYNIIKWSENWTRIGSYKVFIIYEEINDGENPKKEEPNE